MPKGSCNEVKTRGSVGRDASAVYREAARCVEEEKDDVTLSRCDAYTVSLTSGGLADDR